MCVRRTTDGWAAIHEQKTACASTCSAFATMLPSLGGVRRHDRGAQHRPSAASQPMLKRHQVQGALERLGRSSSHGTGRLRLGQEWRPETGDGDWTRSPQKYRLYPTVSVAPVAS